MGFQRIIPSHLDEPIAAGPKEFAHAIDIMTTDGYSQFSDDVKTLEAIEKLNGDIKSLEEPGPLSDPGQSVTTSPLCPPRSSPRRRLSRTRD